MFNRSSLIAATTVAATLFLGACSSKDTGVNTPGDGCTSTAVAKGYDLLPVHPSIAFRYRDENRDTETNTRFACAESSPHDESAIYPTDREVTVSLTSLNKANFGVKELISSTQDERGGTIKLHGYRVSNFPLRILVPNSTKLLNVNVNFEKAATLFNSLSFDLEQSKTLDFGEATVSFPGYSNAEITSLMIDLAPLTVAPGKLDEVGLQALKDAAPLVTAFLNGLYPNPDSRKFPIQMQGSTAWTDTDLNVPLGNRIGSGEEIQTKMRMSINFALPAQLKLIPALRDVDSIKFGVDTVVTQRLVPKTGVVRRDISIEFDGQEKKLEINEILKLITKGDTDGDYALDVVDDFPNNPEFQKD